LKDVGDGSNVTRKLNVFSRAKVRWIHSSVTKIESAVLPVLGNC
jgi:hypothetical protein